MLTGGVVCGNTVANGGKPAEDKDECDMRCKGNTTELCGGGDHLNLYDFELRYTESLEEEEEEEEDITTSTSSRYVSSIQRPLARIYCNLSRSPKLTDVQNLDFFHI